MLDQSGYEEEVERRPSKEKEKAAKRQVDIEMRSVEISVRGTKMKAFRKETPEEKASRDRNNFWTACGWQWHQQLP